MLFYGPPGTGKTSTVLALAKDLYGPELVKSRVLELNASDERGISIIRDKVKNFARTAVSVPTDHQRSKYPCPPYKIIILDEADSMTNDAQSALRRTMETYSKITRFCLICNYVTRIIDPLASRCSKFRFKMLDQSNALQRLQYIANNEGLKYEPEVLTKLLDASAGDLRKAITLLQSASKLHGYIERIDSGKDDEGDVDMVDEIINPSEITVGTVYEISGTVPDQAIDDLIQASVVNSIKDIKNNVDLMMLDGWSATQVIIQMHDKLIRDESPYVVLTSSQRSSIAWILSLVDKRLNDGADEHLEILDLMLQIGEIIQKK